MPRFKEASLLRHLAALLSSSGASDVIERLIPNRAPYAWVCLGPLTGYGAAGRLLDMKIKRERWGGDWEEDKRGTDEGMQRGDDKTGCEKWRPAGERWCLAAASGQCGPLVGKGLQLHL